MSEDEPFRITAYITNKGNPECPMTHYVTCPVCQGRIGFNLAEIEQLRSEGKPTSVYCAGYYLNENQLNQGTTGGGDPNNHYHPGYPPDPIIKFDWERE